MFECTSTSHQHENVCGLPVQCIWQEFTLCDLRGVLPQEQDTSCSVFATMAVHVRTATADMQFTLILHTSVLSVLIRIVAANIVSWQK